MPFKPGQSGNPGGRPRNSGPVLEFRQRCREFMERKGWAVLEEIATTQRDRDSIKAVELMAAYGYGRPTQPISGDADPELPPIQVTVVFDKPDADGS
jgi:hypothetical protein